MSHPPTAPEVSSRLTVKFVTVSPVVPRRDRGRDPMIAAGGVLGSSADTTLPSDHGPRRGRAAARPGSVSDPPNRATVTGAHGSDPAGPPCNRITGTRGGPGPRQVPVSRMNHPDHESHPMITP
eukprot:158998-Hanusia_phi.AAC.1